ncbi:hypothetical protein [Herbiconiux liangxiaofengii]|uniref:hypothetical protein n=1 Tax=Herbiconiux liangxiaofengii TaxID=3342795 RepID=UPI0035B9A2EF
MVKKNQTPSKRGRRPNLQAPWSEKGWYSDEYEAARDPEVERVVEQAGRSLHPYGYKDNRPGLAISPVFHNPYLNLPLTGVFVWGGLFLFEKLRDDAFVAAVVCLIFFSLVALIGVVMSALRAPGWHRARRDVRAYIAEHGGPFPPELLWYR